MAGSHASASSSAGGGELSTGGSVQKRILTELKGGEEGGLVCALGGPVLVGLYPQAVVVVEEGQAVEKLEASEDVICRRVRPDVVHGSAFEHVGVSHGGERFGKEDGPPRVTSVGRRICRCACVAGESESGSEKSDQARLRERESRGGFPRVAGEEKSEEGGGEDDYLNGG